MQNDSQCDIDVVNMTEIQLCQNDSCAQTNKSTNNKSNKNSKNSKSTKNNTSVENNKSTSDDIIFFCFNYIFSNFDLYNYDCNCCYCDFNVDCDFDD